MVYIDSIKIYDASQAGSGIGMQLAKGSQSVRVVSILIVTMCQLVFPNNVFSGGRPEGININSAWVGYDLKSGDEQPLTDHGWAFSHLRELLPTVNIPNEPTNVIPLEGRPVHPSDITILLKGRKLNLDEIAKKYHIRGIAVFKDGKLLVEGYYDENQRDRPYLMMSMSKSIIGTLASIYVERGLLDLEKTVAYYLPEMAASGWAQDDIRSLLDMRDGSAYDETYNDPSSALMLHSCSIQWLEGPVCPEDGPQSSYKFLPTVGRNDSWAGKFVYKSGTVDVVAWVLESISGMTVAELITREIWGPIGAEYNANITVDRGGYALAMGGMSATLRDQVRFGQLMLNRGRVGDKQIAPKHFFDDVINFPGDPDWPYPHSEDSSPYYRSFFWGVGNGEGDFEAIGINGQIIRAAPKANMVIVLNSAWPREEGQTITDGWDDGWDMANSLFASIKDHFSED